MVLYDKILFGLQYTDKSLHEGLQLAVEINYDV